MIIIFLEIGLKGLFWKYLLSKKPQNRDIHIKSPDVCLDYSLKWSPWYVDHSQKASKWGYTQFLRIWPRRALWRSHLSKKLHKRYSQMKSPSICLDYSLKESSLHAYAKKFKVIELTVFDKLAQKGCYKNHFSKKYLHFLMLVYW